MDSFLFRDGELYCEDVPMREIARTAGTPTFVYSRATLEGHLDRLREAFAPIDPLICYSVKSCGNLSVLRTLAARGAGMDVVSIGELQRALEAGVPASRCVYAGVGKRDDEIAAAIDAGIGLLNVESEAEFENIARIAAEREKVVQCALRINPDVDPKTHRYTSTGKKETKFGVDLERARRFFQLYGRDRFAKLEGLHLHIGSPIYTVEPYVEALTKTCALIEELAKDGIEIRSIDLGGGFGADYETAQSPSARDYAAAILPLMLPLKARGVEFFLEPGRSIAANAGVLLLRVLYTKDSGEKHFAICDAGMNALLRPSHYGSFHFIWPVHPQAGFVPTQRSSNMVMEGLRAQDIVGPLCESGDFLAVDRAMPPLARGDLLAVFTAGAYGMSMASRYNSSPLPAEVLVSGNRVELIRRRETVDDLVEHERNVTVLL